MASTYTTNLGIEKIQTGQQAGQWGDTTNTNFDIIDQAVNGIVTVTLTGTGTSGSPNDIAITDGAESDGRNKFIRLYSASDLGGTVYVRITPSDAEKIVHIRNDLNAQDAVIFQGNYDAGRSIGVSNGRDVLLKFDGGGDSSATVADVNNDLGVTALTAGDVNVKKGGGTYSTLVLTDTDAVQAGTGSNRIEYRQIVGSNNYEYGRVWSSINTSTGIGEMFISTRSNVGTLVDTLEVEYTGIKVTGAIDATGQIEGASIQNTIIGSSTAAAGTFTNLTATGTISFPDNSISGDDIDGGTISNFASTGIDDNATSTAITIDSSEQVGIGTASPAHIVDIVSSAAAPTLRIKSTDGIAPSPKIVLDGSNDATIQMVDGALGGLVVKRDSGAELRFKNTASEIALTGTFTGFTSTGIDDNATETAVTIDSSERVGVGTTTPSSKLHVYGANTLGVSSASLRVEAQAATYPTASFSVTANNSSDIVLSCGSTAVTFVKFENLPTSDPSVAGQVWNDSGTLKISAG